ncbi:YcgN family cysteine cluster protein [Pelagerythrobacter rhizovicinus]|uniref:YcgN family cysteine cluster protein n=1 Tax=Pelagerythrobacter rhizovicinus TaxID=2268576 RepID=A0A4Q2KK15_9SPHN|nr:YcgN family cysteine cluster protein [Pelagerythrobacter rhizovicinus]RXZ65568.1 YcgN family cysteine cluster protein [Pelagerythrobacter rhizovicinus]
MGALRDRFWERPLAELTREEWEALCDGCGRCCLHKIEDADTGEIEDTNVACKLLDTGTARCRDYRHRKAFVPDCLRLTLKIVGTVSWLPESCAYRRRAADEPLPDWHPLLTGDPESVKRAGASVAGRVVSETEAGPLEHHIVDWSDR